MPLFASCTTITAETMTIGLLGLILSAPAWWFFGKGVTRLVTFIRSGAKENTINDVAELTATSRLNQPGRRLATLVKEVALHTELARKPLVAAAHWLVMVGFLLGSFVWFEAYIQTFNPAGGWPLIGRTAAYHVVDEFLGVGTVLGILVLMVIRRLNRRRFYGSNERAALFVELVVLLEGVGMILVKAGKISTYPLLNHADWTSPVSGLIAQWLPANATMVSAFALLKLLTGMVWLYIVGQQLSWGVAWHRFLAFFNIFYQRNPDGAPALGKLPTPNLDATSSTDEDTPPGVGTVGHMPWKMLLDAATCTECGRCQEQCPAWNTGKPLSPKLFVRDLRDAALDGPAYLTLVDNVIEADVLWSCTNCGACVEQCPVDIEHIDHVANLRRYQVLGASDFPSELTSLFKNVETKGNPWGRNSSERMDWIEAARRDGIEVPLAHEVDDFEYLFWVGCAGTYDDNARATTRATVELLHTAGVKFAVLGSDETCTGDPVRRAGNEFLFQMLAQENVNTLNNAFGNNDAAEEATSSRAQRKIITTCAHCFNTLRNEYPDFGGHFDVFHHTQLLNRLVREGLLKPIPRTSSDRKPITYHDPCFLGRHNKVFDPPRELLESIAGGPAGLIEMNRNRNNGFCCGAGGARMFMEEKLGTRIADNRAEEARSTGAGEVAVGCPFCNTMLGGGIKATAAAGEDAADAPQVRDVAVMLRDSIMVDGALPKPRAKAFLGTPVRRQRSETKGNEPAVTEQPTGSVGSVGSVDSEKPAAPAGSPAPVVPVPPAPPAPAAPAPGGAVPKPGASVPKPGSSASKPGSSVPRPGGAVPKPGASVPKPAAPAPGGAVPKPGASVPKPGSAAPAPGSAVPKPGSSAPKPGSSVPRPGSAVPKPGASVPKPGSSAPKPGSSVPRPGGAVPRPGSDTDS